jgi:hypothetical protein
MDIVELSKCEDVFYYMLSKYVDNLINIRYTSKYFKNYIDIYIDKTKKMTHTINFDDYGLLQKYHVDTKNIIRWSKMVVFIKYNYENNNQILVFLLNNFILEYINKYHIWIKQKITQNISHLDKSLRKTKNPNIRQKIIKNKTTQDKTLTIIQYKISTIKIDSDDNYNLLLISDHPNIGILKLIQQIKNILIFDLLQIKNPNILKQLNYLHTYKYKPVYNKKEALYDIQLYIPHTQYSILYDYFMELI